MYDKLHGMANIILCFKPNGTMSYYFMPKDEQLSLVNLAT